MEINKTIKSNKVVNNPEGSLVKARDPKIQLYLEGSNLKVRNGIFYKSAKEVFSDFVNLAKHIAEQDQNYVLGLSKYLADKGLKLSPVILLSILSDQGMSFRNKNINYIFNTPKRIAEAVALENLGFVKLNNSLKKNVLRECLQNFDKHTLKKNRLESRSVKLKDLIKLLRPKPKNEERSKMYKDIIESNSECKLDEESLVTQLSDEEKSNEDKKEYIKENVGDIPINQLIRNLKFIGGNFDFKEATKIRDTIYERLESIDNYRFLNLFDLIEAAVQVPEFEKPLFQIVKNYCDNFKEKFDFGEDGEILFDISGSMFGRGIQLGFKYLVLISLLFNCELNFFSQKLIKVRNNIVENVRKGSLKKAKQELIDIFDKYHDGTALLDSAKNLVEEKEINNLIVVSDEVSWKEGVDLRPEIKELQRMVKDKRTILMNPVVYRGTVFRRNLVAMAGLTSSILNDILLSVDKDKFIEYVKNYKKDSG